MISGGLFSGRHKLTVALSALNTVEGNGFCRRTYVDGCLETVFVDEVDGSVMRDLYSSHSQNHGVIVVIVCKVLFRLKGANNCLSEFCSSAYLTVSDLLMELMVAPAM